MYTTDFISLLWLLRYCIQFIFARYKAVPTSQNGFSANPPLLVHAFLRKCVPNQRFLS